jgi:hypothetical protein
MDALSEAPASVEFGGFRVLTHRRKVLNSWLADRVRRAALAARS